MYIRGAGAKDLIQCLQGYMGGAEARAWNGNSLGRTPRLHPIASGGEHIIAPSHERGRGRSVYKAKIWENPPVHTCIEAKNKAEAGQKTVYART